MGTGLCMPGCSYATATAFTGLCIMYIVFLGVIILQCFELVTKLCDEPNRECTATVLYPEPFNLTLENTLGLCSAEF